MSESSILPCSVLDIVAQNLIDMGAFGTLEEKWKIFKASPGSKFIRYMIGPPPSETTADLKASPIISSTLAKTLKASVELNPHDQFWKIQVHLYAQYGYSKSDMAGMWRTLAVVRNLSGFEDVTEIDLNIHSRPGQANDGPVAHMANLPTPPIDGWLCTIVLQIDDSVQLKVNDYLVLSTHVITMLRPYAVMRLEREDETMECPEFRMFGLRMDVLLANTAVVTFDLHYTEDDENDVAELGEDDVFRILGLLAFTAMKFKQASRTIPLTLLGRYLAWNEPEWFVASVKVDAAKKEMNTHFHRGFHDMINEVVRLEDVATTASAGKTA
ncbi:hypothetical protein QFC20_007505 [Naganishia adeliensis]|uniref:Uncharacterized protein n=1 Tax=Naganishia adeliensis TaxID=92952 RepID=A0ACC2UYA8_9TREE|nr:hypothetical protein QFC20_007505 [Naganishia adeliensis]